MQAVLFEMQLLRAKSEKLTQRSDSLNSVKVSGDENENTIPEYQTTDRRRSSQGSRSILLKGEMRYLKDTNMLIFLCSPL
jgi:guanylate cyclase